MKGIAIAMETIVYIILAVLVLGILIYFLTSQAGPVQNLADNTQKASAYCSLYIQLDSKCTSTTITSNQVIGTYAGNQVTTGKLIEVCGKLGTLDCGSNDLKCIQRCCTVCPTRPS
jgi:hypothetical protein